MFPWGRMFDGWVTDPDYPTLFRVDRPIAVYAAEALPSSHRRPFGELPLWVRAFGLRLEVHMPARQVAWLRRSDGGWLAVVLMQAASSNQRSRITIPLWLDPRLIATDLSVIEPYEGAACQEPNPDHRYPNRRSGVSSLGSSQGFPRRNHNHD